MKNILTSLGLSICVVLFGSSFAARADESSANKTKAPATKSAPHTAVKSTTKVAGSAVKPSTGTHSASTKSSSKPKPKSKAVQSSNNVAIVTKNGKPIWLDYKNAKLAQKKHKLPIFTDFSTEWCGWCHIMDKTTFKDPAVEKFLANNFICMKLDAEDGAKGQELAQGLHIGGYPAFVVFDAKEEPMGAFLGFQKPQEILKLLRKIMSDNKLPIKGENASATPKHS